MLKCNICKNKNTEKCNCELHFDHRGTVFDHTLEVLKCLPKNASFELQMAALLHDIGKNEKTFDNIDGKCRFIHHEFLGAKLAKKRLEHLKFTNNEINKIVFLIEHHMDVYKLIDVSDKSIRKFIRNTNEYMDDLFILVDADGAGTHFFDKNNCIISSIAAKTEIQNRAYKRFTSQHGLGDRLDALDSTTDFYALPAGLIHALIRNSQKAKEISNPAGQKKTNHSHSR